MSGAGARPRDGGAAGDAAGGAMSPAAGGAAGVVVAVCVSDKSGVPKHDVPAVELVAGSGIAGDAHAGPHHRQVSLLAAEAVARMEERLGRRLAPGAFAENVLVRGLDLERATVGWRLALGPAVVEVTQIGKECHAPCAIYRAAGDCIMPRLGVFTRVVQGGRLAPGDPARWLAGDPADGPAGALP